MSYASLNGRRIVSGRITIPYYGIWVADILLALSDGITSPATVTIGDLSLVGSIYRAASFTGTRSVRLIGGAGGWRKTLPAQFYQSTGGVRLSMVLGDAAAAVGETVKIATDTSLGTAWTREGGYPAERLLRFLAGPTWWMDNAGVTQVGPRTGGAIGSSFQVINWSGGKGSFEIATETLGDWMPGRTFTSVNVKTAQTVGMTTIDVDNDGKLRLTVLSAGPL